MDKKDLFTALGILVSVIISVINLFILIKNRRNVIREHLYKEQMAFYLKLSKKLSEVSHLIDLLYQNILNNKKYDRDTVIDAKSDEIHNLISEYDFIIPNEIYTNTNDLINKVDSFILATRTLHEENIQKAYDSYYSSYYYLLEDIRDILGVDKLSKENLKLIK